MGRCECFVPSRLHRFKSRKSCPYCLMARKRGIRVSTEKGRLVGRGEGVRKLSPVGRRTFGEPNFCPTCRPAYLPTRQYSRLGRSLALPEDDFTHGKTDQKGFPNTLTKKKENLWESDCGVHPRKLTPITDEDEG